MKNINPLVSVIIPSYNGLPFLKDAIKSVLEQSYKNFELIIVDDSSEDNTYGYILSLIRKDKRIKYFKTPKNTGTTAAARNFGVKRSKGKFLSFLDADDLWHKNKLEKQINSLKKNTVISCTAANYKKENTTTKASFLITFWRIFLQKFFISKIIQKGYYWLYVYNPIIVSSVLIKKEIFNTYKFVEDINQREDLALWLKLMTKYNNNIVFIDKVLVTITRRDKSVSANRTREFNIIIRSISNDFIHRNDYKKFSYFLFGIFLRLLKIIIAIYYSILRKNIFNFFYVLIFLFSVIYYSPLFWYLGKNLLYYNESKKTEAIVLFSGHGSMQYYNNTYLIRYEDIKSLLKKEEDYEPKIYLLGRLQKIPEQKIIESLLISDGVKPSNIIVVYKEFSNTKDNVINLYKILKKDNIKEITFITSPYHTKRSKKLWEKYAANIEVRIFKSLNWPEKNSFFEKAMNKKLILYEQFAYIYNKIKKWI
jgi:teichuronic acid biosynthesis glycosyltransferase TuaG